MKNIFRKGLSLLLCLVMIFGILSTVINTTDAEAATFSDINNPAIFYQGNVSGPCNLAALTMLLRRVYIAQGKDWKTVTQSSVQASCCPPGKVGPYYSSNYNGISISHKSFSGGDSALKNLLANHPEGIVLYNGGTGGVYHGVLVTDYTDGVFYCADYNYGSPSGRIPLSSIYGKYVTTSNATEYWYVSSPTITLDSSTTYTLTYNANGGSGAPATQTYTGDYVTLSTTKPYRTGYTFKTWTTTPNPNPGDVIISYKPGSKQIFERNITLYALWEANTYYIEYNANGGSGSMSSSTHYYDTYKSLNYNSFTRSGYTFLGWSTSSSATSATYSDGQSVVNLTSTNGATITLYAVWKYNPPTSYTLSYNANGGSTPPSSQSGSTTYTISSTKPTRSGYTFLGWSKSSSATSPSYYAGDSITISANTTLYAVWSINKCGNNLIWNFDESTDTLTISGTGDMYDLEWNKYPWYNINSNIKSVTIGNLVTSIGDYAFYDNDSLTSVSIGSNVTNIGDSAFRDCDSLTEITIPNSVVSIDDYAFSYCRNLTEIVIGNSVTNIGISAFSGCCSLTSITIPEKVTSIDDFTFHFCTNLTNVTIGNRVVSIGESAFGSCTNLKDVYYNGTKSEWESITLYEYNEDLTNANIHFARVDTYTLSYNANGGSAAPSSQSGSTNYTVSSTRPTRSGYTFLGWSKSSSATSPSYYAGDTITISSNTTLYAVWSKNTLALSYNANGGSGAPSSQSGATSYTISSTKPTRSGYTFLGWSKSSSATSPSYYAGDTITISSNTTLYAVWSKNTFALSYNANGGSGAPSSQSGATNYTVSSTRPTRSGYTFLGWSKSSSATSPSYVGGDSITISANTTLYAVWSRNTYTLSYNANGGSGAPSSQSGATSYTISSTKPTRSGYTFLGWSKSSSATSPSYYAGDSITISSNTTLYAVWSRNTYTLSYNANGGSGAPSSHSGSTTYTVSSTRPTRSGYTFLGWSKSSSATSPSYYAGDSITISSNTTLYAVWSKNTYTLSYNTNGGSYTPSSQTGATSYTVTSGTPIKSGYIFLGWSLSSSATSPSYYAGDSITISSDTTLYAVWKKALQPAVKIRNNPGTSTINYGDSLVLTAEVTDMPSDAKIYWYVNGNLAGEGETLTVDSAATVMVKLVDSQGKVLRDSKGGEIHDVQTIKVNSGFFQMIISFFKNLFGANRTTIQLFDPMA